jgi:PAS domain S-box-containing protein
MVGLKDEIGRSEDWLMDRILTYARQHHYTQYTSTLAEAWRLSISELSRAIMEACDRYEGPPELDPDEDYSKDPIAAFGVLEARRHRTRGITLSMFLGLLKYYRQCYLDRIRDTGWDEAQILRCGLFVDRCFDRIEIGFVTEWLNASGDERLTELQSANRRMTNEKNKYLTIFESLHEPAILLDEELRITNINHAGLEYFRGASTPGALYYQVPDVEESLSWLPDALAQSEGYGLDDNGVEMSIPTKAGLKTFHVKVHPMLDVSDKFRGTVVLLDDITDRKEAERKLAAYAEEVYTKNRSLEEDLLLAREIQQSFLPRRYPTFPHGVPAAESAVRFYDVYRPALTLGGDFFDVLPLSESQAGVLICDVMGHGAQGALVAAVIRGLLQQLRPYASQPGRFLTEMNRELLSILSQPLFPVMTTAFYLVIDTAASELRFSNAGHPIPLLLRRATGAAGWLAEENGVSGPALGLFPDGRYQTGACGILPKDLIILFTDGLFEVIGPSNELYGTDRLCEAARRGMELAPAPLLDKLLLEAQRFAGDGEIDDDICLVGVEFGHPFPRHSI